MAYQLEGRILEVCDCNVLCPCWIGEDPDPGTCDAVVAWHIDKGTIGSVDVSGRTLVALGFIPGNILQGNWKVVIVVDDGATPDQQEALLQVWSGKLGGPIADLAQLIGERGMEFGTFVDTVSCVLTVLGLYMSFTGDAKDWFDA